MANESKLIYTNEARGLRFENSSYITTGNKYLENDLFTRCDGGSIQKDDKFIANFNFTVNQGQMTNLWVNFTDPMEAANIMTQINALFTALCADCKTA